MRENETCHNDLSLEEKKRIRQSDGNQLDVSAEAGQVPGTIPLTSPHGQVRLSDGLLAPLFSRGLGFSACEPILWVNLLPGLNVYRDGRQTMFRFQMSLYAR
jgi:hypothetical protein